MPEANWYPDPDDEAMMRYWDGQEWTDQRYRVKAAETLGQIQDQAQSLSEEMDSRIPRGAWQSGLPGANNWQQAQQNKGVSTVDDVSIFDNGKQEHSSIFDSSDQQLWGDSDQPSALHRNWQKVPKSWRKPIVSVALIAFLIWILPSLINLVSTALNLNQKRVIFNSVSEQIQPREAKNFIRIANLTQKIEGETKPGYLLYASEKSPDTIYQCKLGSAFPGPDCQVLNPEIYKDEPFFFVNNIAIVKGKDEKPAAARHGLVIGTPQLEFGNTSCFAIIWQNSQATILEPRINCHQ